MLIYIGVVIATAAGIRHLPEGSPWRFPAMLPLGAAAFTAFWIELRQLRRFDEMQRAIYLEASLGALWAVTAVVIGAWFMERLGDMPRLSPLWYLVALGVGFVLGYWKASRRFR